MLLSLSPAFVNGGSESDESGTDSDCDDSDDESKVPKKKKPAKKRQGKRRGSTLVERQSLVNKNK